jgi:hypothetical protein
MTFVVMTFDSMKFEIMLDVAYNFFLMAFAQMTFIFILVAVFDICSNGICANDIISTAFVAVTFVLTIFKYLF